MAYPMENSASGEQRARWPGFMASEKRTQKLCWTVVKGSSKAVIERETGCPRNRLWIDGGAGQAGAGRLVEGAGKNS